MPKAKTTRQADVKIIKLKPSDWNSKKEDIFSVEHKTFEKDSQFEEIDFAAFKNPRAINYMAYDGKKPIGYLMSCHIEADKDYKKDKHFGKNDTICLESIAIIPEYQGIGLGKRLFKRFLALSKRHGYKRIILDATSKSMEALAEKYEFTKVKFYRNWIGKRGSWLMEKMI